MLDRIQNNNQEAIVQSQGLDKIKELEVTNPIKENDSAYFIDESVISNAAYEKYQHELDVKKFSEILLETDEQEANSLVLNQIFDNKLSIDNDEFLSELLMSENFLNDIA